MSTVFRVLFGLCFIACALPLQSAEPKHKHKPIFHYHEPAVVQHNGFWPTLNLQNNITQDGQWVYLLHNQARFLNETHSLKTVLTEGSVGYTLNDSQRIWAGYYYSGNDFGLKTFTEQRLFQQFYWKLVQDKKTKVALRSRLEENQFSNRQQNQVLFRQLLAKEWLFNYKGILNPLVYDEMFFKVNNPTYGSTSRISQNRFFLGFNLNTTPHSFWRIGYSSQYITKQFETRAALNHVFIISYTYGIPDISLPIDS